MQFSKQLKAALLAFVATASTFGASPAGAESISSNSIANDPQEGYEAAWRFIRDNYVDQTYSGQDWNAWEHKFNVRTQEEEFQAIKAMMDSLHDPYTRPLHVVDAGAASDSQKVSATATDAETPVEFKMLENRVGYVKISSLASSKCAQEVATALKALRTARAIVLDLRGNHGGLVRNALEIADLFLLDQEIVTTVSRTGKETFTASGDIESNQPLAVLVDGQTASASEILAGALQDNHRATLVGSKTFGKGLVQDVVELPGVELHCTVSHYLTPKGTDINKVGLTPDISSNDQNSMQAALEYLEHNRSASSNLICSL